ncbi:hypothetical protein HF521_012993 [Silurus meridionalis]|uniref:Uncharacterized protein n=1 Tax=Silurus meridionalis TaxID=175797 RepID=A0A8T0ACB4_SILME|nr:hypothetical protein HF521_012993 [Silurus meridionalis]
MSKFRLPLAVSHTVSPSTSTPASEDFSPSPQKDCISMASANDPTTDGDQKVPDEDEAPKVKDIQSHYLAVLLRVFHPSLTASPRSQGQTGRVYSWNPFTFPRLLLQNRSSMKN